MLEKINKLKIPIINFTSLKLEAKEVFSFDQFNSEVFNLISNFSSPEIAFLDTAYDISNNSQPNKNLKVVQDHINLSNLNPFIGRIPPKFFAVNNLYKTNFELEKTIVVGLNPKCKPSAEQSQILIKVQANYYVYNLVLASLVAAFYGKKVIGLIY